MNKIYKVIWSKVKNQYVVVSELAHSSGKQSRTSRSSIRSRIATLVVCGAIAAFGVFSALPNSAYAAENYEYIAFQDDGTLGNNDSDTISLGPNGEYTYVRTKVIDPTKKEGDNGRTQTFWVREGFSIELVENVRFDQNDVENAKTDTVIVSHKSEGANEKGLILSYQNVDNDMHVNTLNGDKLLSSETGMYGGGVNTESTAVTSTSDFVLRKENGDYTNIRVNTEDGTFVTLDSNNGLKYENNKYYFKGEAVDNKNLYVLDYNGQKKIGVFTLGDKLYTGSVYGRNNEILMTGINSQNKLDSYWGTEIDDPEMSISQMTMGDLDERFDKIKKDIVDIHKDDIKEIQVTPANTDDITKGGTIRLQTNGEFDSDGNPTGGVNVPGTITIRNTDNSGINGNDVKIRFGSIDEYETDVEKFTVDAGSKVVGKITTKNGLVEEAGVDDANKTLTGLKINGVDYVLSQGKTYDKGDGISIDESTNKISVALAKDGDQNVSGLHFKDGKLVNDLQVTNVDTETTSEPHNDGGNWTITKTDEKGTSVDLTNTTLSSNVSKEAIADNVAGSGYGNTYTISDTDGNTATLEDVASATKLSSVDSKIGELNYSSVTSEDNTIKDNDSVTTAIGKLDNKVNTGWTVADGNTETANFAVKPGETLTFNGDDNVTVEAKDHAVNVSLKDNITLGDKITLSGEDGKATIGGVKINNTYNDENGSITSSTIDGLTNKTWDSTGNYSTSGKAATEAQLQAATDNISGKVDAGWKATAGETSIEVKPTKDEDGNNVVPTLNFAGDDNISVTADNTSSTIKVTLDPTLDVTSVDAKGTTISSAGLTVGGNTYVSSSGINANSKKITNVADGTIEKNSKDAVNAGQLYDVNQKVDAGWTATDGTNDIKVNPKDGTTTLKFAGDNNIAVTADTTNKAIQVALNDKVYLGGDHTEDSRNIVLDGERGVIGLGSTIALDGRDGTAVIGGVNIITTAEEGTGKLVSTINGLSNTTWTGTTETPNRAATEGQLQSVATEAAKHTTVSGDENITVKHEEGSQDYQVTLNPDVTLKGDNSSIELNGTKGTMQVNQETTEGTDFTNINGNVVSIGYTNKEGTKNAIVIDGGEGTITGLSNTTWDGSTNDISRAATEGQLKAVSDTVNAGWIATDNSGKEVAVNPDNNKLKFAGDDNITVSATTDENNNNAINVKLNDNITLGNGQSAITLNGSPENSNDPALSVGTDKFVVDQDGSLSVSDKFNVDAETGNIYAANNSGSAIVMNDDSVAFSADGNGVVASDEGILLNTNGLDKDIRLVTKGTIVSVDKDGATFTNTNTNETTNIDGGTINVGDKLVVDQDGTTTIAVNDGTVMGNNTTMTVNKDGVAFSAYGNGTTVIDGQTISAGGVVINNNGSGTINGLTNTTWDDELAKQVANSEELQGTAATQGQLQQAVNEVAEVANAGWNAKAGGNTINVKPNETLNFEGDGNITVSATSGTSSELKFGLNHNITLDNVKDKNTMLVINTDGREGYIPDNYKDSNEDAEDFIRKHGGFAIYYANPSLTTGDMTGTFGVTTDGVVHAKDVISYYSASSGSQSDVIRYSLNDVGDIVTQISHAVFDEGVGKTGMEYTLISDFEDEADKDSPFDAKEGKTRTIGLAVRQDGAVIVGAVVNDEGISRDRGIRINAETKTTYDKNGNEVTNNIATITGLENTEWKPPTPVATLAANDGSATVTSRAATESQLNDLYSAVAAYDVNVDGTIDYSHIALAGTPYGASRSGNGTHTGGTSITNVAYASGNDGSEAVNVDYLNDAINNAVKDGGAISDSDRHLQEGTYHVNDQGKVELIVADEKGENQSTVIIDNIANKNDITNLDNKIDNTFNDLNDKINNIDNVETDVKGGNINEDGTISLKTENEDGTTTNVTLKGQLTDSGVVQEGTSFDKETGTITITSQDKYSGETSSVKVEGIASTEVVGATNKEDLATAYKDADKDGNATTEYITDSESMVEADVALDHAIQDVAGTSYANDMVLSNRIDSVEKRLGNVEERIDKVGAMAAAIANLRTMGFDPEAPTEIAIGVGQYKSETGIAIGVFHYPNQDFMLSASLSSSGDELMGGIGATWKLGRKSAAERAKDEEARHLEQAEEMKKLAQQEKVKAQAQRHAKLLAERQQASQKNA